jgi:hypothetical protein
VPVRVTDIDSVHELLPPRRTRRLAAIVMALAVWGCSASDEPERTSDGGMVERCAPVEALQYSNAPLSPWPFEVHTCKASTDCVSGEQCFIVDSIGLCAPARGLTCAEHPDRLRLTCRVDPAMAPAPGPCACGTDEECYVAEQTCSCQPFVGALCQQPGCASNDECGAQELCVPGLLHPNGASNNQCQGPTPEIVWGCRRDADCAAERCGRCVFYAARPQQAGPPAGFVRTDCVYPGSGSAVGGSGSAAR